MRSGVKLHAHHVLPVWFAPDRAGDIDNLLTVCEPCHREIHTTVEEELAFASQFRGIQLPLLRDRPRPPGRRLVAHPVRITSVRYVGVQPCHSISIKGENRGFVANGLIVRAAADPTG